MSPTQRATPSKQKCKAKARTTGRQCTNPPIRGGTVCRMHGGAAPQVRAKAEAQLKAARDELMEMLLGIARDGTVSVNDRLKAITWALERAGFKGGVTVQFEAPGWQQGLQELFAGSYGSEPIKVDAHAGPPVPALGAAQPERVVQADDKLPDNWR